MMANMNETPSGERVRIGFFGMRNAGKSSLLNAVCGQDVAVVAPVAGTTTDAVRKALELLPLGPVEVVDTPGLDDEGALGEQRVERARRELSRCDVAVLVVDGTRGLAPADRELLDLLAGRNLPAVVAWNKCDLPEAATQLPAAREALDAAVLPVSAQTGEGVAPLKEHLANLPRPRALERRIVADLVAPGEVVVLVCPVDGSAPRGRLILPQQMTMRDCLDAHVAFACCQPAELASTLEALARPPRLVVTDSQAFAQVEAVVPADVPLTGFSLLMARYKGRLGAFVRGARALSRLRSGQRVLIAEGCTHHRQCEDIGTVKLPAWIRAHCGAEPRFDFASGPDFPRDLAPYACIVHCGACMLNPPEVAHRVEAAEAAGVPIVNYGVAIAAMHGILDRALEPFAAELPAGCLEG